jgi:hypothetical protein
MKFLIAILFLTSLNAYSSDLEGKYSYEKLGHLPLELSEISTFIEDSFKKEGKLKQVLEQTLAENDCFILPDGEYLNCFITTGILPTSLVRLSWGQGSAEGSEDFRLFLYLIPEGTGEIRAAILTLDYRLETEVLDETELLKQTVNLLSIKPVVP